MNIRLADTAPGIPDPTTVTSWPAAVVTMTMILAILVVPSVLSYMGNQRVKAIETSLQSNNGGSSVRDALDRIEAGTIDLRRDLASLRGDFDTHVATAVEPVPDTGAAPPL